MEILKLQAEFDGLKQQLSDSRAMLIDLCDHLQKSLVQHKATRQKLQESAAWNGDEQLKKTLEAEYDILQLKLQSSFDQVTTPKAPLGRRIVKLFRRKSWNGRRTPNIQSSFVN
jgi:hypothetical protein